MDSRVPPHTDISPATKKHLWQYAVSITILLAGILCSAAVYLSLYTQEQKNLFVDFKHAAQERIAKIKKTTDLDIMTVKAVRAFYSGSVEVSREELTVFAKPFVEEHPSIHAIAWAPRVSDVDRTDFEKQATQEDKTQYQISDLEPDGTKTVAPNREEYFPILFRVTSNGHWDDLEQHATFSGLDLAAIPEYRLAMKTAWDTGGCVITGKINVPSTNHTEIMAFVPVYHKSKTSHTTKVHANELKGYVVAILDVEWLVKDGIIKNLPPDIQIELFDSTTSHQTELIYAYSGRPHQAINPDTNSSKPSSLTTTSKFRIAEREWNIVCTATPRFIAQRETTYPWFIAIGILIISGVLSVSLFGIAKRNIRTTRLADQLAETNHQLTREVKERELAEKTLRTNETKYKALYEASRDAIVILSPDGQFLDGNPASMRMFACRSKQDFFDLSPVKLSPDYQQDGAFSSQKITQALQRTIETGYHNLEWTHQIGEDKAELITDITLVRMDIEGEQIVLATLRDITKQRRAEKALQASERRLRLFADNVEDVLWTVNHEEVLTYLSPSIEQILGIRWDESMEVKIADTMTTDSHATARQTLRGIFEKAKAGLPIETQSIELELVHLVTGNSVWTEVTVSPMYDESGEVIGALGVARDINERRQMERELREAKETAEAATHTKSQFLANMSHEIRTPMTAILGYADLLLNPKIGVSSQHNYVATIRRNGEHLLNLINDILDISKIEAGKMTLDIGPCYIALLLDDVASMVRPRAMANNVEFSVEYQGEIPETILTDDARLRQAIINLAGNATKFTEEGSVRIVVSFNEKDEMCHNRPAVRIQVIDTGIGIKEETLKQLFQPFAQGDSSITHKYGGTGLGLAISHHIAHMLGGDLVAQSVWKEGSTFTLAVPTGDLSGVPMINRSQKAEQEIQGHHDWQLVTNGLEGIRVLFAEDGFDNRELVSVMLAEAGAHVEAVENGKEAVEKVKTKGYDVILMDINMPVMDGYQATSLLRSKGYDIPIIAVTANAMTEDRERCMTAGCDEYISKPIDRVLLIQTINRLVENYKASC